MKNRKEIEAFILKEINALLPGSENDRIYKDWFASMSDKEFDELLDRLESEENILPIIAPNLAHATGGPKLSVARNLSIAERLGLKLFERIWIDPGNGEPKYLSNDEYLIIPLPLRRQAQLLVKKMSVPKDNKSVNDFTGQPSGKSEASRISYPETLVLASFGMDDTLTELLKYRGGDIEGMRAMDASLSKTGAVSMKSLEHLNTKPESTRTLHSLLTGMHFESTLLK